MPHTPELGRILIVIGIVALLAGLTLTVLGRIPFLNSLGRLPGDIVWRRGSATIHIPIVTSILLSIVLSLILALLRRH